MISEDEYKVYAKLFAANTVHVRLKTMWLLLVGLIETWDLTK